MAIVLQPGERDPQRIVDSIIQLTQGRQNSVGDVTLRDGQVTTTVSFPNVSKDSRIFLFPQTANAAAAVPTTYILKANILQKSFTITHANAGTTDRTFSFLAIGG
jgi:ribosomal protein L1